MDVISSLPDEVLGRILSFLPTKGAGRTSVFSKRWRYAFLSVSSLEFDYWDFRRAGERNYWGTAYWSKYMNVLENLVDLQGNSSIKKLSLKCHLGVCDGINPIRFRSWVCGVFERGVVDLNLDVFISGNEIQRYEPVPWLIFKSKILVNLRLARDFTIKLSPDDYLPMLRTLCLSSVDFKGDSQVLGTLISRCPVLEELVLENDMQLYNRWTFSVSSPSLKRLFIRLDLMEGCIIFSYVPNLVYFELSCQLVCFLSNFSNFRFGSLIEARLTFYVGKPRLELSRNLPHITSIVNAIKNVKVLHVSHSVLELIYLYGIQLPLEFNSLVRLSLNSVEKQGWEILPLLIKNSPNLETVIFKGSLTLEEDKKDGYYCHDTCLSSSKLKVLEISGNHEGYSRDFEHMKPVLEKLPCLELLKICVEGNRWRYFELIMDMIPRASVRWNTKVQVIFEPTRDRESCLPRGSDTESNCLMF